MPLETPVLLIAFNRPDTTKVVFGKIRDAKPKQLFLATDGYRAGKAGEKEKCAEVHDIISKVDWYCEVKTLYRTENLGCGRAPSEAITWFFEHVEDGIILEDDCVPDASFFGYCTIALDKYRDNPKVMHVSGNNHLLNRRIAGNRGFFSHTPFIWGWATWRRAWKLYDFHVTDIKESIAAGKIPDRWVDFMTTATDHQAWDYQWTYAILKHDGLALNPPKNLIYNIGFGMGATHTLNRPHWYRRVKLESVDLNNIKFPLKLEANEEAEEILFRQIQLLEPDDRAAFVTGIKNIVKAILFIKR